MKYSPAELSEKIVEACAHMAITDQERRELIGLAVAKSGADSGLVSYSPNSELMDVVGAYQIDTSQHGDLPVSTGIKNQSVQALGFLRQIKIDVNINRISVVGISEEADNDDIIGKNSIGTQMAYKKNLGTVWVPGSSFKPDDLMSEIFAWWHSVEVPRNAVMHPSTIFLQSEIERMAIISYAWWYPSEVRRIIGIVPGTLVDFWTFFRMGGMRPGPAVEYNKISATVRLYPDLFLAPGMPTSKSTADPLPFWLKALGVGLLVVGGFAFVYKGGGRLGARL